MKKIILFILLALPVITYSQSKTTRELQEKYDDAFTLFFYNNTLNMLNQTDDPDFAELIKDIEKMKFLRIDKVENKIDKEAIKELIDDYHDDYFEDLMTMRHEDMYIQAYIQEKGGVTTGLIMLMTDDESLSVLDIKGRVPLNKLTSLISKVKQVNEFDFD